MHRGSLSFVIVALAACGRTGLEVPSDDDAVHATGGTATGPGTAGHGTTGGAGGFLGVGGTQASGAAGSAGANPTHPGDDGGAGTANPIGCVIRVLPFDGDDGNDGTSWDRAVRSLTRALVLAHSECEVWLASGTYMPLGDTRREATFTVPDGVTIRGGFVGTERTPDDRTFAELLPLLSGNVGDEGPNDDLYHVVTALGAVTLDHVYVTHGHAPAANGGGAIVAAGALTLDSCNIFKAISDGDGGGILAHGALTAKDSTFTELIASKNGGAIFADGGAPLTFDGSLFDKNAASDGGAIHVGAGQNTATLDVTNGTFTRNTATGAAAPTANGGAITFQGATVTLSACSLLENDALAGRGGALYSSGDAKVVSSVIARNSAVNGAGLAEGGSGLLDLLNVTIAANESGTLAALDVEDGAAIRIVNSILWGDVPAEIVVTSTGGSPNPIASNMSGTYPNLSLFNPRFVDAPSENYRLLAGSPCIDHGDDSRAPPTDLLGNPRVGKADMGAYEYGN